MRDPATAEPVIREYATKGYDLIISHGDHLAEPTFKVAKEFPKVHFAVTGGPDVLQKSTSNVEAWTFDYGQQGYLAGFVASTIKAVHPVGLVAAFRSPRSRPYMLVSRPGSRTRTRRGSGKRSIPVASTTSS